MTMNQRIAGGRGPARRVTVLAGALALAVGAAGCDSFLDVENPNDVVQEDLENATAVNALVNGALAETAEAVSQALRASMIFTDEYFWVGSQNGVGELERGELGNNANEYNPFLALAEARWISDEAIKLATEFKEDLRFPKDFARAHLYAGINYVTIADFEEDFAFSDRTEAAPPVGPSNMASVYDTGIERLTVALSEARALGDRDLEMKALAMRARAHWAKAQWHKLNPSVDADPWINSQAANDDARALLAMVGDNPNWRYDMLFSNATVQNTAAAFANSRLEFRVHEKFGTVSASGKTIDEVTYPDIIDTDQVSPILASRIDEFVDGFEYSPLTLTSAREMRLILAEAAHAAGNTAEAVEFINANRALDGSTLYDPAVHAPSVEEMLIHERLVNLFIMPQRRWADMYRFGIVADEWVPGSAALAAPGTFFPIHRDEALSNCHILGTCG